MKQAGAVALLLLLLSGCGSSSTELERGMALRSRLLQASGVSFETDITADYGDKVHSFSMSCRADEGGNLSFTVTAPESISGITGTVAEGDGRLTFENTALCFDLMAEDQITPVSAPWILLRTLRGGYLTSAGMEEDQIRLTINDSYEDDALQLDIWLDEQELPVRAEIVYDQRRILSLDVKAFEIL